MGGRAAPSGSAPPIVRLDQAGRYPAETVGVKAHTLARLRGAGFPVPDGVVITAAAEDDWRHAQTRIARAVEALGADRVAVRSSAAAEDLEGASFAGQYETLLDVTVDRLPDAVRAVFGSAGGPRPSAYRRSRAVAPDTAEGRPTDRGDAAGMAVLVQVMVDADVAGVAFTADPLTGRRDDTVVTAVRGLGEALVSGRAEGAEWVVRAGRAICRRPGGGVLEESLALAVARMAQRVAEHLGGPQDIEWAAVAGTLYVLQARPLTALPDPVSWQPPGPGRWMRNFRIGEWLPEPMTPLFGTWLLGLLESGMRRVMRETAGAAPAFRSATVNGWYYTALPHPPLVRMVAALIASRGRLAPFVFHALIQVSRRPERADHALLGGLARRWRDEQLPRHRATVADATANVDRLDADGLIAMIDRLGMASGAQLAWLELLGGSAWKMEACLARFVDRHLPGVVPGGVGVLLQGLGSLRPTPDHAVHSLDWYHPTAGEREPDGRAQPPPRERVTSARQRAERACRDALAGHRRALARFEALLGVAQRYAVLREEQAHWLTLAWPVLRRAVLRLGAMLHAGGVISSASDVFFLHRADVQMAVRAPGAQAHDADLRALADDRRAVWQRQRRLVAPLTLGRASLLVPDVLAGAVATIRRPADHSTGAIVGHPASPGRATGPVRVLLSPDGGAGLRDGDVLVVRATTPAWTPLFARVAAVVTDGGSVAAHASLIAREYGIPAVVATGDATVRLHAGQVVTVDGSAGVVET